MMLDDVLKCDACGRFIAWRDVESGKARHEMITPSAYMTWETWDDLCPQCKQREENAE